jgi:hypothetical protein
MRQIKKQDINEMNDIIMELPAFKELRSKEMIHDILNTFMERLYIEQPNELFDAMQGNPNERMQETFLLNYGIDKKYSNKIKGYLKKDISYKLEKLFKNKGSKVIFKHFAQIFENIFRKINFYNIKVHKIPIPTGFMFEYRLEPLYITDEKNIIKYPQIPIEKTRKYLMDLDNFKEYTVWPMSTNLVYIQLSIGEEIINNQDVFLHGIQAYANTYLQGKYFNYKSKEGIVEKIHGADLELLIQYFQVRLIKEKNPSFEFDNVFITTSYLPYDPELVADPNHPNYFEHLQWTRDRLTFLNNMEILLHDYGVAESKSRQDMEILRRRWQMFLNLKFKHEELYETYDDFYNIIKERYPLIQEDFDYYLSIFADDNEPIFDFYVYIYSIFLNGVFSNPEDPSLNLREEWVISYIDVLFGNLFVEADFLKWYFNPVMDLFIRYFFPIEMEYINDLMQKIYIKDKWNAIGYDDTHLSMDVYANHWDAQPLPILALDWKKFHIDIVDRHSYIDDKSIMDSTISHNVISDYPEIEDNLDITLTPFIRDTIRLVDGHRTLKFRNNSRNTKEFYQQVSICFKMRRTKEYLVRVLDSVINNSNIKEKNEFRG